MAANILNIDGGTFTGYLSAVEIKAGDLNIEDGTFKSTVNISSDNKESVDVPAIKGAAIAISNGVAGKETGVNIHGGAFFGCYSVYDIGNASDLNIDGGMFSDIVYSSNNDHFICGGTFSINPNYGGDYVASGCTVEGSGPYVVN